MTEFMKTWAQSGWDLASSYGIRNQWCYFEVHRLVTTRLFLFWSLNLKAKTFQTDQQLILEAPHPNKIVKNCQKLSGETLSNG